MFIFYLVFCCLVLRCSFILIRLSLFNYFFLVFWVFSYCFDKLYIEEISIVDFFYWIESFLTSRDLFVCFYFFSIGYDDVKFYAVEVGFF